MIKMSCERGGNFWTLDSIQVMKGGKQGCMAARGGSASGMGNVSGRMVGVDNMGGRKWSKKAEARALMTTA